VKLLYVEEKLNPDNILKLKNGEMEVSELYEMSLYECSDEYVARRTFILSQKDIGKFEGIKTYVCPNCHARNQEIEEIQKRALDEGATVYSTCIECKKRWVVG
jgi:DNA-directed RNA polymerase subunit M/transcription elongation factor TFIIS